MVRNRNENVDTNLEKLSFAGNYSMKNIPISKSSEYMKKMMGQMEKFGKRIRWKVLFFLKDDKKYKKILQKPFNLAKI